MAFLDYMNFKTAHSEIISPQSTSGLLFRMSPVEEAILIRHKYHITIVGLWKRKSKEDGDSSVAQWFQTSKTRQELDWKIREIDGSYLYLQQFDKFWIWSAQNDRKWKLFEYTETCMKAFVKSLHLNLFFAGFSHLKPTCLATARHTTVWSKL